MLKKIFFSFFIIFLFLVFFWINISHLDPDFGWHLKMGELIFKHGIPKTDPFSYTMPSYPFVDHEWLSNVLIFLLNQAIGYGGLAVLYVLLIVATPFFVLGKKGWSKGLVSMVLIYTVFISRVGIRPQIESWFLFGILIGILWNENMWKKVRWFIPLLFLAWVNLHGSFALGIGTLVVFVFGQAVQDKKFNKANGIILLLSFIATFLSPYGWRNWWEVFMQMTDPLLHRYIIEWLPFYSVTDLGFIATAGFVVGLLRCFPKKLPALWKMCLVLLLFLASLSAVRHMPFFVIVGGLLIVDFFELFYQKANKSLWGRKYVDRIYCLFICTAGAVFLISLGVYWKSSTILSTAGFYPIEATKYVQKHSVKGRLFNNYTWGGYLIWKLPQYKVFIDGRMPSFRSHSKIGESSWVLKDYMQIMQGKNVQTLFSTYNITAVLIPNPYIQPKLDFLTRLLTTFGFILPMRQDITLVNLLERSGWVREYQDPTAVLLVKP